jgi:hypothetical protein
MSIENITNEMKKCNIDDNRIDDFIKNRSAKVIQIKWIGKKYLNFYRNSLKSAGEKINELKRTKALKDVIGKEYEQHRKRLWEFMGYTVDKKRNNAAFDVDWSIYYRGNLVALEEDKGHYVDKCFFERCIHGFIGTINNKGCESPKLILSAFTMYNLHINTERKSLELYKDHLVEIFRDNYTYNYINKCDRFPKNKWFSSDIECHHNPYEEYQNDELIIKDIQYMLSFKK